MKTGDILKTGDIPLCDLLATAEQLYGKDTVLYQWVLDDIENRKQENVLAITHYGKYYSELTQDECYVVDYMFAE